VLRGSPVIVFNKVKAGLIDILLAILNRNRICYIYSGIEV
jgi:hypothetical protein